MLAASSRTLSPVQLVEAALFSFLERLGNDSPRFLNAVDFCLSARGHLSFICVYVVMLLIKSWAFELSFDEEGEFWFARTLGNLIAIQVGCVLRNAALKVVVRRIFVKRNAKAVRDVLFYEETARRLSAPLRGLSTSIARVRKGGPEAAGAPGSLSTATLSVKVLDESGAAPVGPPAAAQQQPGAAGAEPSPRALHEDVGAADGESEEEEDIRRTLTPTHFLENERWVWGGVMCAGG